MSARSCRRLPRTAVVVGGGFGGLASALALSGQGWDVQLLERAAYLAEADTGLSVWPNALNALNELGLGEQVRAFRAAYARVGIRDRSGRWLFRVEASELVRHCIAPMMLRRSDLLNILLKISPEEILSPGVEVFSARADRHRMVVEHSLGETSADLVVAADGIDSTVRRSLWPAAPGPRYAGYTGWQLIAGPQDPQSADMTETWGCGQRFGYAPLPDGRVYCYATANAPAGGYSPDGELIELRRRFGDWHEPIPALLAGALGSSVVREDVYDLPSLPTFAGGRAALLGDAAHAMTPDLGQGACLALEDAVSLAAALQASEDISAALATYSQLRRGPARRLARLSRRMGAVGQWDRPLAIAVRNAGMRFLPESVCLRFLVRAVGAGRSPPRSVIPNAGWTACQLDHDVRGGHP